MGRYQPTSSSAALSAGTAPAAAWWSGMGQRKSTPALKRRDLTFILGHLATLLENGVSLPKALATLLREKSLQKHTNLLTDIRRRVETGETFSSALSVHPESFSELLVNQVRVGERSGGLADSLTQVTGQLEKMNELRSMIVKKLSYPVLLSVMGAAVVTFMLIFVIPVFEETYADAHVPLPLVTRFLIGLGAVVSQYYWMVLIGGGAIALGIRQIRKNAEMAYKMDAWLLRLPLVGNWLRDLAVLQLMDVLGNLMESGFKLVEALSVCAGSVGNRAVKRSVRELESAVLRGERFSRELELHGELFPPVVSQLVIIGEQTGNLAKATAHIREHLRKQIERNTSLMVGTIEPVLTISLAAAIGVILLAIYLPMFDMISAVTK